MPDDRNFASVAAMFRRGLVLAFALLLAGCGGGDGRAPFTESRIPPGLAQAGWPPEGWAFGLIQTGKAPPQRYGVLGPTISSRAQVLILPGYGDFAEAHYAEAKALADQGFTVWVLDGVGQGGSGRYALPRDLGHLTSFDADAGGIVQMVRLVIRPTGAQPLAVIAGGTAAPLAAQLVADGRLPASGLVLDAPSLAAPANSTTIASARAVRKFGLSAVRAPGASGWDRADPSGGADDPVRIRHAWQIANPDLRMGGPSLGWLAAFGDLGDAFAALRPGANPPPVLILAGSKAVDGPRWRNYCAGQKGCFAAPWTSSADAQARKIAFIQGLLPKEEARRPGR